jgi:hypothetical protein
MIRIPCYCVLFPDPYISGIRRLGGRLIAYLIQMVLVICYPCINVYIITAPNTNRGLVYLVRRKKIGQNPGLPKFSKGALPLRYPASSWRNHQLQHIALYRPVYKAGALADMKIIRSIFL